VLGFLGGEHEMKHHIDALIDELYNALPQKYETKTPGVFVEFVFKTLGGDNKAMAAMLQHLLGAYFSPVGTILFRGS